MATINLNKLLFIILLIKSSLFVDALKCYQCGMYNDGVGSITPCLNYTETTAPNYLKDCPKSSDNYCIVSFAQFFMHCVCVPFCSRQIPSAPFQSKAFHRSSNFRAWAMTLPVRRDRFQSVILASSSVEQQKSFAAMTNFARFNCSKCTFSRAVGAWAMCLCGVRVGAPTAAHLALMQSRRNRVPRNILTFVIWQKWSNHCYLNLLKVIAKTSTRYEIVFHIQFGSCARAACNDKSFCCTYIRL